MSCAAALCAHTFFFVRTRAHTESDAFVNPAETLRNTIERLVTTIIIVVITAIRLIRKRLSEHPRTLHRNAMQSGNKNLKLGNKQTSRPVKTAVNLKKKLAQNQGPVFVPLRAKGRNTCHRRGFPMMSLIKLTVTQLLKA